MMNPFPLTAHAAVRCQQRNVPRLILDWLLDFGAESYQDGACVRFFDKAARRRLVAAYGRDVIRRLADYLDLYLVEGRDGRVVTVGHHYGRVQRR